MIIILKPHILQYPEKIICHRVVKMILTEKTNEKNTDHDED